MGLRAWWNKMWQRDDEERIELEKDWEVETAEERRAESENWRDEGADAESSRLAGETIKGAERLGDAE